MSCTADRQSVETYTTDDEKFIELATSVLHKFKEIAEAAKNKLQSDSKNIGNNVFVSCGDASRGSKSLSGISASIQADCMQLSREPAIARVVIQDIKTNEITIYYVSRCAPPSGVHDVVSYRAAKGRLAALTVGEIYDLGEETNLQQYDDIEIRKIQNTTFTPVCTEEFWDAKGTEYRDIQAKTVKTIKSLRYFDALPDKQDEDILARILKEESDKENTVQGRQRDYLAAVSLRDQAILDSCQDEIFRLPLGQCLMLLGPAGSGKTTTLIRRLGQKLDTVVGLTEDEQRLVDSVAIPGKEHAKSWLMFTPTELLKGYLKEAFNREGIPAPDLNIATWRIHSLELGKSAFKILCNTSFDTGFHHDSDCTSLIDAACTTDMYTDFYAWLVTEHTNTILLALENLKDTPRLKDNDVLKKIRGNAENFKSTKSIEPLLGIILKYKRELSSIYDKTKKEIDSFIDTQLGLEIKRDNKFLHDFSSFLKVLSQNDNEISEEQEDTVVGLLDEDDEQASKTELQKARLEYRRLLMAHSQSVYQSNKKKLSKKNEKLIGWLGGRLPVHSELMKLHTFAVEMNFLSVLNNPVNKFFKTINTYYSNFRKLRQKEGIWYNPESTLRKKITSAELDILLLTSLTVAHNLLRSQDIFRNTSDPWLSTLERVKNYYFNQILVDEAPDFSPVQLSCMRLLSHPQINSFFACGDFNQRLASAGTKSFEELERMLPGKTMKMMEITIPYRQTKRLYDFSTKILQMVSNSAVHGSSVECSLSIEGYKPVLGRNLKDEILARWISEKIIKIERFCKIIPSIAILVPEESYVKPVAQQLQSALNGKTNVIVQACLEGQALGSEKTIRIFDVKHIKGLEFEAAFFVAIDRLDALYPDLLMNYLYVGATRAASFLGVTYEHTLPKDVDVFLGSYFATDWEGMD